MVATFSHRFRWQRPLFFTDKEKRKKEGKEKYALVDIEEVFRKRHHGYDHHKTGKKQISSCKSRFQAIKQQNYIEEKPCQSAFDRKAQELVMAVEFQEIGRVIMMLEIFLPQQVDLVAGAVADNGRCANQLQSQLPSLHPRCRTGRLVLRTQIGFQLIDITVGKTPAEGQRTGRYRQHAQPHCYK